MKEHNIRLADYKYDLPNERIAKFPLSNRSESKLLVYKDGITHEKFNSIADHIPADSTLFFNDTKVIPARLHFQKETGALIEIFLLEPILPTNNIAEAMLVKNKSIWKCMIGNYKKWKDNVLKMPLTIHGDQIELQASIHDRGEQQITFTWSSDYAFVDIVEAAGKVPLPPYISREVEREDQDRYQTIYSAHEGAVAAPTAGLHFTDKVIDKLREKSVKLDYLTLHVSAGTFQPIKEDNAMDHPMHAEQVVVSLQNLETILQSERIVSVGTTSMRTLESLYWYGVKLLLDDADTFQIPKLYPYKHDSAQLPDAQRALTAVRDHMLKLGAEKINGHTEIFIFPGYQFKVCHGLITNYHLPGSTLILLVAAFIGEDWRKVYQEALDNQYRFLSYGDSSLLLP